MNLASNAQEESTVNSSATMTMTMTMTPPSEEQGELTRPSPSPEMPPSTESEMPSPEMPLPATASAESGAIWDKLAQEQERRRRLRSRFTNGDEEEVASNKDIKDINDDKDDKDINDDNDDKDDVRTSPFLRLPSPVSSVTSQSHASISSADSRKELLLEEAQRRQRIRSKLSTGFQAHAADQGSVPIMLPAAILATPSSSPTPDAQLPLTPARHGGTPTVSPIAHRSEDQIALSAVSNSLLEPLNASIDGENVLFSDNASLSSSRSFGSARRAQLNDSGISDLTSSTKPMLHALRQPALVHTEDYNTSMTSDDSTSERGSNLANLLTSIEQSPLLAADSPHRAPTPAISNATPKSPADHTLITANDDSMDSTKHTDTSGVHAETMKVLGECPNDELAVEYGDQCVKPLDDDVVHSAELHKRADSRRKRLLCLLCILCCCFMCIVSVPVYFLLTLENDDSNADQSVGRSVDVTPMPTMGGTPSSTPTAMGGDNGGGGDGGGDNGGDNGDNGDNSDASATPTSAAPTSAAPTSTPPTSTPETQTPSSAPSVVDEPADTIPPTSSPTPTPVELFGSFEVIIIGGGLAGLAAAKQLEETHGINNFVILEANSKLGGRCQTTDLTQTNRRLITATSTAVETGSAFIPANTPLAQLWMDVANNTTSSSEDRGKAADVSYNYDNLEFYQIESDDPLDPDAWPTRDLGKWSTPHERNMLRWYWNGKDGFVTYLQYERDHNGGIDDDLSYFDYLALYEELYLNDKDEEGRAFLRSMLNTEILTRLGGGPVEQISVASTLASLGDDADVDAQLWVDTGFQSLIQSLAPDAKTELGAVVSDIHYQRFDADGKPFAEVIFQRDGQLYKADAPKVIVTVPLGVLKDRSAIRFTPPLPSTKQQAIDAIGFASINKCILQWDTADDWWPKDEDIWLSMVQQQSTATFGLFTLFFNARAARKDDDAPAILVAHVADSLENQSEDAIVDLIMKRLQQAFLPYEDDTVLPRPTSVHVTRWDEDEYARGTHSFAMQPNDAEYRELLRKPLEEVLYFAGEATNVEDYGTTSGAYDSGIRAANDLAAAL